MRFNECLLRQLPGLVFWKDTSSTYAGANQPFLEFSEAPNNKLEGMTDKGLPWADYADIYQSGDRMAMAGEMIKTLVPILKRGRLYTGLDVKQALLDEYNKVIGMVGSLNIVGSHDVEMSDVDNLLQQPEQVIINKHNIKTLFRGISLREAEVLYFVVRGQTMQMVAGQLHISIKTIESHLANIKQKWSIRTKSDLIAMALNIGFLHCKPESLMS